MSNFDFASRNTLLLLNKVKGSANPIQKYISEVCEKEQSVETSFEQLAESASTASNTQRSTVQLLLLGFASTIKRVEANRKTLYEKLSPYGINFLVSSAESVSPLINTLKKRDSAMKRASKLTPPKNDDQAAKNKTIRSDAVQMNSQFVQEFKSWQRSYHQELTKIMREYSYAQLEFAAKSLEQWSNFAEDIELLDFDRDTDEMITLLEDGHEPSNIPNI